MKWLIALLFSISIAHAQSIPFPGPGGIAGAAPTYQGPADVAGAAASVWGSCARSYSAAYANGSNAMCDLVAITGGAAVCTLRVATTGFVDLTAYCPGSLTPAAACAAASGGSCAITKVYNQVSPGTNDLVQATLAQMPGINFNDINGLPSIDCGPGGATSKTVTTLATINIGATMVMSGVYIRNGNLTSVSGFVGNGTGTAQPYMGSFSTPLALMSTAVGSTVTRAATDNAWHGVNGTFNSTSSVINVDGAETTGNPGSNSFNSTFRFCRGGITQATGHIAEGGIWVGITASRPNLYTNQHGSNGYNGAF